jgi:2-polyprenyl-3-methyl-5-hydroxy-6-metoxy-1,4-benzoquinol methylase
VRQKLTYETLERLAVRHPVDRLKFIANACKDKVVLDIGCFDETALAKRDTEHWLHGRIVSQAREVVGIDNSTKIPESGIVSGSNAAIYRGDGTNPDPNILKDRMFEIIVAGEFIEHIESPLRFFRAIREKFQGQELIISTPNGVSFANTLLGTISREVQHHDHLQIFTFKILNTLCLRAGFKEWEIVPYRFYATEMMLKSKPPKRALIGLIVTAIRCVERCFPLLSFGYIIRVRL